MAENKKSFVLYCDYIHTFSELSDSEAGQLIKHIFGYVNDKNPEIEDRLLKIAFEPIKQQLKRDLRSYEETRKKLSEYGRSGGLKRVENLRQSQAKSSHLKPPLATVKPSQAESSQPNPTQGFQADNVTVTVTDTVTDREDSTDSKTLSSKENTAAAKKFPSRFKTKKELEVAAAAAMIFHDEDLDLKFVTKQSKNLATKMFDKQPIRDLPAYVVSWLKNIEEPSQQKIKPEEQPPPDPIIVNEKKHIPKLNGNGYVYPTIKGKFFNKEKTKVQLDDGTWQDLNDKDQVWAGNGALTPDQIYKGKK